MNGSEPRNSEHRNDGFGDLGHINNDPVAFTNPKASQHICRLLHFGGEFGVGDAPLVTGLTLKKQGDAVAQAVKHVPVETVIGDVDFAIGKPPRKGGIRPVECFGEGGMPVKELPGLLCPKLHAVFCRLSIKVWTGHPVRNKIVWRGKATIFVQERVNGGVVSHVDTFVLWRPWGGRQPVAITPVY